MKHVRSRERTSDLPQQPRKIWSGSLPYPRYEPAMEVNRQGAKQIAVHLRRVPGLFRPRNAVFEFAYRFVQSAVFYS